MLTLGELTEDERRIVAKEVIDLQKLLLERNGDERVLLTFLSSPNIYFSRDDLIKVLRLNPVTVDNSIVVLLEKGYIIKEDSSDEYMGTTDDLENIYLGSYEIDDKITSTALELDEWDKENIQTVTRIDTGEEIEFTPLKKPHWQIYEEIFL